MEQNGLSEALSRVHEAAKRHGGMIVFSRDIERADRELLVATGWLQEILRGWYMFTKPGLLPGESSAWYANFWDFVRIYLEENYDDSYCLSAEHSLDLHLGKTTIPKQVVVIRKAKGGTTVALPFDTSILVYADPNNFPPEQVTVRGIRVMSLAFALCKATPTWFHNNQADAEIALQLVKDVQELVRVIGTYQFIRAGERLIGAYRALGELKIADKITESLLQVGMYLKSVNPFEKPLALATPIQSPYEGRIRSLWARFRTVVLEQFPAMSELPRQKQEYLERIDEIYLRDAYNSLSIEGYQVDPDLIRRVERNDWNPDLIPQDREERNALAARGYYEAFQEVKKAIAAILDGASPGEVVERGLQTWFQKLFSPSVQAGILKPHELLGYRRFQVYIRSSRHIPLPKEALSDAMQAFFACLKEEEHPAVQALLGHFMFVYIHPYMDGNGRLGRFLMNVMLASGGYPWTVIEVKRRSEYFAALENASVEGDIEPFVRFVRQEMKDNKT